MGLARAAAASPRQSAAFGMQVREQLEALGGSWRGFALFLSSRCDLFDPVFCAEVARTRIVEEPVGIEAIAALFEKDFSRPLDSVLADFDARPLWISGLSQLHEATLRRTGERVWVQVQRPDAADRVKADVEALEKLCKAFERLGGLRHVPWPRTLRELKGRLTNHLDYRFTAYQMSRQWARWREQSGAHAPKVFRNYCGRHVIITERIDGEPLSRVLAEQAVNPMGVAAWFEANGIKPKKLARRLYSSFLQDLIEHGVCLTEFDPSRVLLLRDGHFGLMPSPLPPIVQVEADRVRALRMLIRHLPGRAYASAHTDILGLVEPLPPIDPVELKKHLTRELRGWGQRDAVRTLPSAERTLAGLFVAIAGRFRARRVVFDVNVAAAIQTLGALESSVAAIQPRLRRMRLLQRFFVRSVRRMAEEATKTKARLAAMAGPAEIDADAPFETIDQAERHAEAVSAQSLQFANTASKPAYLFERFFAALRFLTVVAMVLIVLLCVDQEIVRMDALRGVRAGRFLTIAPTLTWLEFIVMGVADVWLFTLFHRITLRFRARDSALPRHGVI